MGALMSKRKSIVSAFGDFQSEPKAQESKETKPEATSKPKPSRVAAGIVSTTQRTLTQIREERDQLLEDAASNNRVIQIDPKLIDPSPFRDRLPDDDATDFEAFKTSIAEEGQKVPITVRRSPNDEHRYQIVYGHRRCRALSELGLEANAIITDYSDRDLVIAQGIENANRQDLSWIERALFADEMQSAGIKPRDIKAALGVDDTELSKFRSVLKSLPAPVLEAIGRAPGVGRPRWLDLSSAVKTKAHIAIIEKTLAAAKVSKLPSNEKFLTALALFSHEARPNMQNSTQQLSMELGEVGSMSISNNAIKINLTKPHRDGFGKFLEAEMEGLLERYQQSLKKN